jgi:hypothetical protein
MHPFEAYRRQIAGSLAAGLVLVLAIIAPQSAGAFRLSGRVVNGTTGAPVNDIAIKIVNPSGGMLVEREIRTVDESGHFHVDDLGDSVPVYLLRVAYENVNYTETVRFDGKPAQTVEITVYERTTSWEGIDITVPHMMVSQSADTLTVERFVQVTNTSSPPKTVYSDDRRLTVYIPPDAIQINSVSVRALGVPLPVVPSPTDKPGFYTIDYPVRPGVTMVQASFDLPYAGSHYHYAEPLQYDLKEILVITQDPGMEVASTSMDVGTPQDFHGFKSYTLRHLSAGDTLALAFTGGSAVASTGGGPTVLIVPNRARNLGIGAMIALVMALGFVLASMARRGHSTERETEALEVQKNELLDQLARLDDLHKTGTVTDQMYRLKRAELMNAVAAIYYRMKKGTVRV